MFFSKAELDYLTANRQFSEDYRYTIKSRLQKKAQQFAREELPLLVEQGYLDLIEFCKLNLTENCKVSNALVAQAGRKLPPTYEIEHKKRSLGGDSNPRPLPYQGNALPG